MGGGKRGRGGIMWSTGTECLLIVRGKGIRRLMGEKSDLN
jgi:hypothetical protein